MSVVSLALAVYVVADWSGARPSFDGNLTTVMSGTDGSIDSLYGASGYIIYVPSFAGVNEPTLEGGYGGTSFVAPQLNGSAAVIKSDLGHRVGFWNPTMYKDATTSASATAPLDTSGTSNDNLFYTGTKGAVYNPATGLGTPNLTKLASDF